jgi:3-phosphoshikimate 1-carboxyvinyltransferase
LTESLEIQPSGPLRGELRMPGDKSISHRAVMLAAIAEGTSTVHNLLLGEDVQNTINAFIDLGVKIEAEKISPEINEHIITGVGLGGLKKPPQPLDLGNSGTSMRLLAGILSGQKFDSVLIGDQSLSSRPMGRVIEPLSLMGAEIHAKEKMTAPLLIQGRPLHGIRYELPVASAQVKSAILLAGLFASGRTEVIEKTPTRDHTERLLRGFGANLTVRGQTIAVEGRPKLKAGDLEVPGDLSSAAFFLVAALIVPGSDLVIRDVGVNPTRTGILEILREMGADLSQENERELCGEPVADLRARASALRGVSVDGSLIPRAIDEFPILCVAAAFARGRTEIREAAELRVKESDRIATMARELSRMGAKVAEREDGLVIEGEGGLSGAEVDSHGDHRVAMALLVGGLSARGRTRVGDTGCISTSFPNFTFYLQPTAK